MFSKFFINRPIFATVISFLIVIAGIISIQVLPVKEYPAVAPPQVNISATYPGADAGTLSKTISSVLENAINGVESYDLYDLNSISKWSTFHECLL